MARALPEKVEMKHQVNSSWVSYGNLGSARWYDAAPSWLTPDPLAEKAPSISPYVYCADNPVNAIDPDGRKVVDTKGRNVFYLNSKGAPQITNLFLYILISFLSIISCKSPSHIRNEYKSGHIKNIYIVDTIEIDTPVVFTFEGKTY
ncbi:MAG: RHS repeat-associated core domain-containing protein, partial [Prevotella sp.]|nr:RHS repeat-associated core domain-containing protein [Prevotella sp.]